VVAVSVGGNAELAGPGGFLPAVAGYDEDGALAAGRPGLADASAIGDAALAGEPEARDARGTPLVERLAALVAAARRRLTGLTQQLVTAAVVVVPAGSDPATRMALLQAVEGGGLDVLTLVEASGPLDSAVLDAARLAEDMRG